MSLAAPNIPKEELPPNATNKPPPVALVLLFPPGAAPPDGFPKRPAPAVVFPLVVLLFGGALKKLLMITMDYLAMDSS